MHYEQQFLEALIAETKRRLMDESVPRIKKCIAQLSEPEIWYRPNDHSNSIGNLILHLCGNARQWIVSGLGKAPDHRMRQAEFDERGPIPAHQMLEDLDNVMAEIEAVLNRLTPEDLLKLHPVQVFEESGLSILVHVVEHFSYHTGQITFAVKAMKNMDMAYYGQINLERKGA
ncbi:MAG: DUF1572 family protein [Saprospiraceae bacterium]|nr:DUF1572 family protein [Saprospiraceae bacterium]